MSGKGNGREAPGVHQAEDASEAVPSSLIDPVPLSMPSILVHPKPRNKAVSDNRSASNGRGGELRPSNRRIDRTGKRKLLRRENAHFTSNPHVVRPHKSDYSPAHASTEKYVPTFPVPTPRYLNAARMEEAPRDEKMARDWRREMDEFRRVQEMRESAYTPRRLNVGDRGLDEENTGHTARLESASQSSGLFTMSLSEAKYFLKRRAGVEIHPEDKDPGGRGRKNDNAVPLAVTPLQDLVNRVESEWCQWQDQVVYLQSSTSDLNADTTKLNPHPRIVATFVSDGANISAGAASGKIEEHHHLPHAISYLIPDAFDRLTVHCLARAWGLRSFSKLIGSGRDQVKLTWILKPPKRRRLGLSEGASRPSLSGQSSATYLNPLIEHLAKPSSRGLAVARATAHPVSQGRLNAGGLETPPTTDIGSEIGSEADTESEFDNDRESQDGEEPALPGTCGNAYVIPEESENESDFENLPASRQFAGTLPSKMSMLQLSSMGSRAPPREQGECALDEDEWLEVDADDEGEGHSEIDSEAGAVDADETIR